MGKLFGAVLTIIAILSAYPIVAHWYVQPVDISTHGHAIDEQLADTMAEAGLSFLAAQLLLAFFVWRFSQRDRKSTRLNSSHSSISYAVFCLKKKKMTL